MLSCFNPEDTQIPACPPKPGKSPHGVVTLLRKLQPTTFLLGYCNKAHTPDFDRGGALNRARWGYLLFNPYLRSKGFHNE